MIQQNYESNNEKVVDLLSGERFCAVSFINRKHVNRIKRIYEERKDDFKFFYANTDGSVCAKFRFVG